jgi:hypothetical protein
MSRRASYAVRFGFTLLYTRATDRGPTKGNPVMSSWPLCPFFRYCCANDATVAYFGYSRYTVSSEYITFVLALSHQWGFGGSFGIRAFSLPKSPYTESRMLPLGLFASMGSDSHDLLQRHAPRQALQLSPHVHLSGHCQSRYYVLRITETLLPSLYALLFFVLYGIIICDVGVTVPQPTKESWRQWGCPFITRTTPLLLLHR